ncbi:ATP-binding protein [Paenibacillus lutrae]|uniref:histidine kinase n=1 Tax=Paenibacillus lutrae TaxID=2078573 RepID=A0A7X3FH77_9BACL|nr:ATP-binding protein [Paenibacillus lutrae]MVO99605.1 histidine kinase [Paenibacillus lutrae]
MLKSFHEVLTNVLLSGVPVLMSPYFEGIRGTASHGLDRKIMTIFSLFAAVLCAAYPFGSESGLYFSLFMVPVLTSFLYGGRLPGFFVSASVLLFLGLKYPQLLLYQSLYLFLCVAAIYGFLQLSKPQRRLYRIIYPVLLVGGLGFIMTVLKTGFYQIKELALPEGFYLFYASSILIQCVTMGLVVYLTEYIREAAVLRQEVHRAEKLNVLSELAASVAHEIRNPMTTARGFMQLLFQSEVSESKKKIYTGMVIEEMDKVQQIISSYLAFATPHADKTALWSMNDLMALLEQQLQVYASQQKVRLDTSVEPSLWLTVNADKLVQCLAQLARNGIESMPEGGCLRVRAYRAEKRVFISIEDEGIGMSPDEIKRLGSPFYSTKQKGTGLSVMVAYRIIECYNGKINVVSEPGKGTCMLIVFPSAAAQAACKSIRRH